MTLLRCVIVSGCTTVLALAGISPVAAGMIHRSHESGSPKGVKSAPKAPKQPKQQSKSPKQPKKPKPAKPGKGTGSGNGTGGVGTDGGSGSTGSGNGGIVVPPDSGTLFDPPVIPDPPPVIGSPDFVTFPGEESGSGGDDLPLLLPGGATGTGSDPPLQFLDLSSPPDDSIVAPSDVTGTELTALDQPLHNPEPSSMLLALLGGGSVIFSRLHRRCRRHQRLA